MGKLELYARCFNTLMEMESTLENEGVEDIGLINCIENLDEIAKEEIKGNLYDEYIEKTDHISNRIYFNC